MKAVVVGSGDPVGPELLKERCLDADIIIAADGGGLYLYEAGIVPDVLIGDFDSIPSDVLDFFRSQKKVAICSFSREKDFTDMELAVEMAVSRGADEVCILSATGTRLDHSAGNILLLYSLLQKGIRGWVEDANNRVYLTQGRMELKRLDNWKVSLIAISPEVNGVTTSGLQYPLMNDTLVLGSCRGVSNEFASDTAVISVEKGLLMVILSRG
ncbi:thiamine diphosphokinase [Thermoclostridium caenicola]|uniref:Thiamine diphosphokinase n=1 Tax=Thermoclostridium caenicola TaxID=659425 RepID=A0A1M6IVP7_9FIRM|nr:thiamine diphosphokinase [Thermoclostridium caenicola]SHJ38517.1 thiamine diphosphokinase [Thermoclostridium caenicola]HPO76769.1 thiamine diphosphokinase [Thermoclostridium caenicola]HPU22239.1 thiamine diphosphokinase [Thermoclostridium caenicola]